MKIGKYLEYLCHQGIGGNVKKLKYKAILQTWAKKYIFAGYFFEPKILVNI